MKILYFAWLREKIDTQKEEIDLPLEVNTVRQLVAWLQTRGGAYAEVFAHLDSLQVAVNQECVTMDHKITSQDEVAFFPPITGG